MLLSVWICTDKWIILRLLSVRPHWQVTDKSIANPTLIFLYCLSNKVCYLQPTQKKDPLRFQEIPTHEYCNPFYLVQLVAFAVIILLSSLLQQFTVFYNVGCCCSTCKRLCTAGRLHLMAPFKHWRHTMPALIMRLALTIASEWSICQCEFALTNGSFWDYCQCRSTLTITPSTWYVTYLKELWIGHAWSDHLYSAFWLTSKRQSQHNALLFKISSIDEPCEFPICWHTRVLLAKINKTKYRT